MSPLSLSRRHTTSPTYEPDGFNLPDNYNVLKVSEIHAFEEPDWSRELYLECVTDQLNDYIETYNVDEVWILGDTGTFEDTNNILDGLEDEAFVKVVAGDEDKKTDEYTGWFKDTRTKNGEQPFDVDVDYRMFDEGFETTIDGVTIQAAHHPNASQRDSELNSPDPRASENTKPDLDPDSATPEELFEAQNSSSFLDELFSLAPDDNENTLEQVPPSMNGIDMATYDHAHMAYTRTIGSGKKRKIAEGLGGRRYGYQRGNEASPERSIHLTSFGNEALSTLHFNAENDQIFEHLAFDREDNFKMYDVEATRYENQQSGYQLIQSRFKTNKIRSESHETADQIPPYWESR